MRRAPALALVATLVACGKDGHSGPPACAPPADGAGWIAYASVKTGVRADVYLATEDGRCEQRISSDPGPAVLPAWSRARRLVAYSAPRGQAEAVVLHDLATGAERVLATGALAASSPAFSPDGTRLVFEGKLGTAPADVYVVPVAGGDPVNVTSAAGTDAGPVFSADGAAIYFVSNRTGPFDVWRVGVDGTDPTPITTGSQIQGHPAVSPDGRWLAYTVPGTDQTKVVRQELATGAVTVVSDHGDSEPAYDATGALLAVATRRFGSYDVVILDAATGALVRRTTAGAGADGNPGFPR